ncbi:MAG TPA: Rrf2 family transcriptional regulator [Acidobacteriota bacterium]|jgi:Rrf2 family protein|nr:Rrf2 family transcriptional regulator [Acidobacteriota bacterium]
MLTTTSEYALRALVRLAQLPEGQTMLGRELAREAGIPANYLSKILLALRKVGIISATRGSGGGYRLARPADSILLAEVTEIFEGPSRKGFCLLFHDHPCSDEDPCSGHAAWKEVQDARSRFLEQTSLAAIAHSRNGQQ